MTRVRVGVLRGGPSPEYDVSLKTGAAVLGALDQEHYEPLDVFIDRTGQWHVLGVPTTLEQSARRVDVFFNGLHGHYGEDGQVQRELERMGVLYTGSRTMPSALAMHKAQAKERFHVHEIKTPLHRVVPPDADGRRVREVFQSLPLPYIVKPVNGGSSLGISVVRAFGELGNAIARAGELGDVLVEEWVRGREASVGVVEDFRTEELYTLPPVEMVPPAGHDFFDEEVNYGGSEEIVPARFSKEEKHELEELARRVHRALGLRHYSRSDFIVSPRGIYVLEVNTLPGLTDESLLPKALAAVGCTLSEFAGHLVKLALEGK